MIYVVSDLPWYKIGTNFESFVLLLMGGPKVVDFTYCVEVHISYSTYC